ncbi:hypothetical protein L1049_023885 [Liquidambar formosana]|uniref:Uncharacterized protein n=1 Tax=Liquidambar formosana TaxID=63359 RepID=A0AAP0WXZ9_LIQFO
MGSQFSKKPSGGSPPTLQINTNSQYTAELSSYEAACQVDPDLQTFDATLHQRTNRVINTLADGVEVRSLSFDSLREVTGCLLEMNQEVVKVDSRVQEGYLEKSGVIRSGGGVLREQSSNS